MNDRSRSVVAWTLCAVVMLAGVDGAHAMSGLGGLAAIGIL